MGRSRSHQNLIAMSAEQGSRGASLYVALALDSLCSGLQSRGVPRQLRIQYPGAMYHVMSRGNRRQEIFLDDVDRQDFLKTLAEACQKTGWQVHAYCMMSNHYHVVLETPDANLVAGMAWLQGTYTIRLNHRHKLIGHVLSGRYKAQVVEGSGTGYLRTAWERGQTITRFVFLVDLVSGAGLNPACHASCE